MAKSVSFFNRNFPLDMTDFLAFQIHGTADTADNPLAFLDNLLVFLTSLVGQSGGDIFAAFFPGIAALDNFHPLVVHFPIAFLSVFFFVNLIAAIWKNLAYQQLANYLLYLGTFSALFAVIAGFMAENSVAHGDNVHAIMEKHELFGLISLGLASFLSGWQFLKQKTHSQNQAHPLFLLLSALLYLSLSLGADLGGLMVYQYGVAVKAVSVTQQSQQHLHKH